MSGPPQPTVNPLLRIANTLPASICIYFLDSNFRKIVPGSQDSDPAKSASQFVVPAGGHLELPVFLTGTYVATCELTGAFVCSFAMTQADQTAIKFIGSDNLTPPNSFAYPVPDATCMIPGDSPRVLVAVGVAANGSVVVREQYWHLSSESFVLAPKAKHTINMTRTSGKLETTSEQQTVSTNLGLSVSGGWGPVSASLSAAVSHDSSTMQQVTISETDTRYEQVEHTNGTDSPMTYLVWQLVDQVSIIARPISKPTEPLTVVATVATAQTPTLVAGPY